MKIYHIRKLSGQDTDFRPTILKALRAAQTYKAYKKDKDTVNVYIASGFFDTVAARPLNPNGNLNNNVNNTINLHHALQGLDNLYLIGAYSGSREELSLARQLKNGNVLNINAYYKWRFHAKIFVITINGNPVFEIIGSSNMTYPAYCGITKQNKPSPNVECDLVIFDEHMINVVIETSPQVMQSRYFSEDNNEIPLIDKMYDIMGILNEMTDPKYDITNQI